MAPTFSICIPVFNGGATVEHAIASVLSQEGVNLECIVVDDASTDDSVVRANAAPDDRLTIHAESDHLGLARNWSRTLGKATGELTMLLGQDDALLPGALSRIGAAFERSDEIGLVAFAGLIDLPSGATKLLARSYVGVVDPPLLQWLAYTLCDTPPPSQVAYRTAALDEVGSFDPRFAYCPELDLQYRIGAAGWQGRFLAEPLVTRGDGADRVTGRLAGTPVPLLDHYRLVALHIDEEPELWRSQRRRLRRSGLRSAMHDLERGRMRSAASFLVNTARAERELSRIKRQTST